MTVRVFYANISSDENTLNYSDYDCTSFEVVQGLLVLHGPARFIPLANIKLFKEIEK